MPLVLALLTAAALAQAPVTVDEALAMPAPRTHGGFQDCDCVRLAWDVAGEDRTLEIPRAQVAALEHRMTAVDQPHALSLRLASGEALLLDEAPCTMVEQLGFSYVVGLGLEVRRVDTSGAPVDAACPDPMRLVRVWDEADRARRIVEQVSEQPGLAVAGVALSARGRDAERSERQLGAAMRPVRPQLGQCWSLDAADASQATLRLVAERDGSVSGVRLLDPGTGSARVDTCLQQTLEVLTVPEPPERRTRAEAVISLP